jgi:NAD(P)-dependent dehydrogenase (short-subunit alcohol dehydrogenase family)
MPIAVVTGTSTGIGFETALHLAKNGYQVFAGMRNLAKAGPLTEAATSLPIEIIEFDVTDQASVDAAFERIEHSGPVDVLVNNAGIGGASPLELVPEDEHRAMFETNYFGAVRCIQAVLPSMRERQTGCIVNVTSVAGVFPSPNQIPYSASKWALESLGAALAHELARFDIRVVNVQPGVIMTNIFDNSAATTRYDKTSPYQPIMRRNGKIFMAGFKTGTQPIIVAETILEAITTDDYRLRWPVGPDAEGMVGGINKLPIEEFIAMGGDVPDEAYNGWFLENFGVQL